MRFILHVKRMTSIKEALKLRISPVTAYTYNFLGNTGLSADNAPKNAVNSESVATSPMLSDSLQGLANLNKVAFKGKTPSAPDDPKTPKINPIENKISDALYYLGNSDIIAVGKDVKTVREDLSNGARVFDKPINKVLFIKDKNAKTTFTVGVNEYGAKYLQNFGNIPVNHHSGDQNYKLKKYDKMFIRDNSSFSVGVHGAPFSVAQSEFVTPDKIKDDNIQIFNLTEIGKENTYKTNKERLAAILTDEEKKEIEEAKKKENEGKITFADVGGQDEVIKKLKEKIIYPIKYPEAFKVVSHGFILEGGPGTGKTLMAEALANEADAHFIKLNGLEMESKWVGESEENWRKLFDEAKQNQPTVIFIDEFDAVAKEREGSDTSRHDDKVVNQILTLMSDIEKSKDQIYIVAATNKYDLLDSAIKRSGRFGEHIEVKKPDAEGCKKILDIHLKDLDVDKSIDKDKVAKQLKEADTSGSDIAAIVADAQKAAYDRENIYEKMSNDTFSIADLEGVKITEEDLTTALEEFKSTRITEPKKRRIGFYNSED